MNIFVIRVLLMGDLCLVGYRNTCIYSYKVRVSEGGPNVGLNNTQRFNPGDLLDMYRNNRTGEIWNYNYLCEKFPCGYSFRFYFLIFVIIYGDISVLHNCMNTDAVRFLM